ncbi:uncharacterized protein F4817DRAFT_334549 [Daldinia loculata]|uniref:uncharacterized protein n=1 Tax=Daldinia loculata TaxID=103429 RepID=UPI0020C47B9C|nr:uncharacterized protein F4817DRAFT_334549 [Daldinia loculata]KAI1648306.1 hypothetical protein F4817DRAFT_334549 [Daldinia loculata]
MTQRMVGYILWSTLQYLLYCLSSGEMSAPRADDSSASSQVYPGPAIVGLNIYRQIAGHSQDCTRNRCDGINL